MALAVLSSRRAEDPRESEDEVVQKGDAQIELVEAFGDLKIPRAWADEVDDKLEKKREAMERGEAWAFPSYGVNPEHDPPWMVEAYHKMLAKTRAGEASSANGG